MFFFSGDRLNAPLTQIYPDSVMANPQIVADIVKPFLNTIFSFPASTNEGHYTIPMPTPLSGILAIKNKKSEKFPKMSNPQ